MAKRLLFGLLAGISLFSAAVACGGSDDDEGAATVSTPAASVAAAAERTAVPASTTQAAVPTPAGPQIIDVKMAEWLFEPKDVSVRPGAVSVRLSNDGPERPHTWVVRNRSGDGELAKTAERVAVGDTATVDFMVMEEGTYEVLCTLPGHADRGQRGTLTVSRS